MRKFLIAAATAASALAVAAPASAQYYPQPRGYAYGYNNHGHIRSLHARLDHLQRQIDRLDSRDRISEREARKLRHEARDLERQLYYAGRNGLRPREAAWFERSLQRLEYKLVRDARDRHRWDDDRRWDDRRWDDRRHGSYNGYGFPDRDRDGRDDRREDDRGYDHD